MTNYSDTAAGAAAWFAAAWAASGSRWLDLKDYNDWTGLMRTGTTLNFVNPAGTGAPSDSDLRQVCGCIPCFISSGSSSAKLGFISLFRPSVASNDINTPNKDAMQRTYLRPSQTTFDSSNVRLLKLFDSSRTYTTPKTSSSTESMKWDTTSGNYFATGNINLGKYTIPHNRLYNSVRIYTSNFPSNGTIAYLKYNTIGNTNFKRPYVVNNGSAIWSYPSNTLNVSAIYVMVYKVDTKYTSATTAGPTITLPSNPSTSKLKTAVDNNITTIATLSSNLTKLTNRVDLIDELLAQLTTRVDILEASGGGSGGASGQGKLHHRQAYNSLQWGHY